MPPLSNLLIKPVGPACNLACSYCFYRPVSGYLPGGPAMEPEVLERMIGDLLAGRPEVAVFGWQGGEPTLAGLDFFRNVVSTQARLGTRGQRVGNALQTNGLLIDDEWARFLAEWRFLVGLSLDGPEPHHNARRGRSWRDVMRAADLLRRHGVAFNILTVLTEDAAAQGGGLFRWFVAEGFTNLQFIPCVEPASLGRPADWDPRLADCSVNPETLGRFLVESFQEWRESGLARGVSERTFDGMIARFAGGDPGMCTFSPQCASYLVVERAGDVYPCDFFVKPEWKLGHVNDGLAALARSPLRRRFVPLKQAARAACSGCEWWEVCYGGCPKDRAAAGALDQPTPLCGGYRRFFSESVEWFRAEAQRRLAECRRQEEAARARSLQGAPPRAIERNAACPCGSRRKFKHCCGRR
jgi:uncharacterized protein